MENSMDPDFAERDVSVGFSGGEKKHAWRSFRVGHLRSPPSPSSTD